MTPNFKTFQIALDDGEWRETSPIFIRDLHPGENSVRAKSVNKWGVSGREHKIVLAVSE